MKQCTKCKQVKVLEEFRLFNQKGRSYRRAECKDCARSYRRQFYKDNPDKSKEENFKGKLSNLLKNLGITKDDYYKKLNEQNHRCAICNKHESEFNKALAIDHNHTTKKVRSFLCGKCNTALGLFNENIELMNKAIEYLKHHE
jgi:Recombination endonuclease VII